MFLTTTKRIIRSGFLGFWRNGFITFTSILVMTITLFILGGMLFLDAMLDGTVTQLKNKVDVNVYLVPDADESSALALKSKIEAHPLVSEVTYRTPEQALKDFTEKHKDDQLIINSLSELDNKNPLGGTYNIKALEPESYQVIAEYIENELRNESNIISKVNYFAIKDSIDRLTEIISIINMLGIFILILFAIISSLITFSTIRLAIYNSREEISVMRLVGASNAYIRGPFVVEGIMYGLVSALFTLVIFYPISAWLAPATKTFFGVTDMFTYYVDNFAQLFFVLIMFGVLLGSISSFLAVKRYLKI